MNAITIVPSPVILLACQHHDVGLEHQMQNDLLSACQHFDQRRGWLSANCAEADTSNADWMDEAEWQRRGC